jgi:hypothetical protein
MSKGSLVFQVVTLDDTHCSEDCPQFKIVKNIHSGEYCKLGDVFKIDGWLRVEYVDKNKMPLRNDFCKNYFKGKADAKSSS